MRTLLVALGFLLPLAIQAADPFFIFAADAAYTDPDTLPVLAKYLSAPDYLGYRAAVNKSELRSVVPPAHLVKRTFTFELSNMLGIQKKRGDITLPASGCSTGPVKARPTLEVQT